LPNTTVSLLWADTHLEKRTTRHSPKRRRARPQHPAQVSSNLSLIHSRQAAADENLLKHKPFFYAFFLLLTSPLLRIFFFGEEKREGKRHMMKLAVKIPLANEFEVLFACLYSITLYPHLDPQAFHHTGIFNYFEEGVSRSSSRLGLASYLDQALHKQAYENQ